MSTSTDCYYGFGFGADFIDEDKVIELCKNHKKTLEDLGEDPLLEEIEKDDFSFFDYQVDACNGFSNSSAVNILANIMSAETNIHFFAEEDDGGSIYVIFEAQEPWHYTVAERDLDGNKLLEIYQKYAKELGFEYPELEYIKVEKFG
jgi:hypothetical protein